MPNLIFDTVLQSRLETLNSVFQNKIETEKQRHVLTGLNHQLWALRSFDTIYDAVDKLRFLKSKTLAESNSDSIICFFSYPIFEGIMRYYEIRVWHDGSTFNIEAKNKNTQQQKTLDALSEFDLFDNQEEPQGFKATTNQQSYHPTTINGAIKAIQRDIAEYSHTKYYTDIKHILYIGRCSFSHDVPKYPKMQGKKYKLWSKNYYKAGETVSVYSFSRRFYHLYNTDQQKVIASGLAEEAVNEDVNKLFKWDHHTGTWHNNQTKNKKQARKLLFNPDFVSKVYTKFLKDNGLTKDDVYIERDDSDIYSCRIKMQDDIDWDQIMDKYK